MRTNHHPGLERASLPWASTFQARLEAMFADISRKRVVVAVAQTGEPCYAAVSNEMEPREPSQWAFPSGCVTKLFTAALVQEAIDRSELALDAAASHLLERADRAEALEGVTVRHLLEHTHGLDDSGIDRAPFREDGRIDVAELLRRVNRSKSRRPGELYSYSDVGAWITAAILERLTGGTFSQALLQGLPDRIGASVKLADSYSSHCRSRVCASRGGALTLTTQGMIEFLRWRLERRARWFPAIGEHDAITVLPGWNVVERGIYLGWKHYGGGWFGHNSTMEHGSLLIRGHPESGVGIVIASRQHQVALVAARLLASVLPELKDLAIPKPLSAKRAAELDLACYCGTYGSAARSLAIRLEANHLVLTADHIDLAMIPAPDDMFFIRPAQPGRPVFVQFLHRCGHRFRYVWDGRQVLEELRSPSEVPQKTASRLLLPTTAA